jgi:hypothetical protein
MRTMSSFPAQAKRVRDRDLPLGRRVWALRECVLLFAPYGYRATWHHLVVHTAIPQRLERDTKSLVRAVGELQAARRLVLPRAEDYTAQRRRAKAAGQRRPTRQELWAWWTSLAPCPDPEVHPDGPLVNVVSRIIDAYLAGSSGEHSCLVCGTARPSMPVLVAGPVRPGGRYGRPPVNEHCSSNGGNGSGDALSDR